ncbi:MAG: TetR/AcrR family transcriptional regulator [Ruminococcus sp.]|nr:TetR/AcrR family transcriptional regulator [Ruminococcus sp.]
MGNLRARNKDEITARKENIISAAAELLLTENYGNITLATISEKTNISRPSMYNYYKTKEEIFLDLMVREYLSWQSELESLFKRKVSRETFCKQLAGSLIKQHLLIRLFSVRQFQLEKKLGDDKMKSFYETVKPFFDTFTAMLNKQFPNAEKSKLDMFKIQFTLYCYSVYPVSQLSSWESTDDFFGKVPDFETIYYKGLMLLTSELK